MSDQTITALSGIIAAAIAALGGGWWGRRKGAADAAEGLARADVLVSTEARAFAADLRAELATERAERRRVEEDARVNQARLEARIDELEAALAAERLKTAQLEARLARLENTPPRGTPAVKG